MLASIILRQISVRRYTQRWPHDSLEEPLYSPTVWAGHVYSTNSWLWIFITDGGRRGDFSSKQNFLSLTGAVKSLLEQHGNLLTAWHWGVKVGGVNGNKGLINIYVFFFHHLSLHLTLGSLLHVPSREEKSHALKGHLFYV